MTATSMKGRVDRLLEVLFEAIWSRLVAIWPFRRRR
jgi:hypothetical protein